MAICDWQWPNSPFLNTLKHKELRLNAFTMFYGLFFLIPRKPTEKRERKKKPKTSRGRGSSWMNYFLGTWSNIVLYSIMRRLFCFLFIFIFLNQTVGCFDKTFSSFSLYCISKVLVTFADIAICCDPSLCESWERTFIYKSMNSCNLIAWAHFKIPVLNQSSDYMENEFPAGYCGVLYHWYDCACRYYVAYWVRLMNKRIHCMKISLSTWGVFFIYR